MLHTFLHDGLLRRFALFFSADLPKRATSDPKRLPVLIIFLHDRDKSAIQAMRESGLYDIMNKDAYEDDPPFVLLFPEGLGGTTSRPVPAQDLVLPEAVAPDGVVLVGVVPGGPPPAIPKPAPGILYLGPPAPPVPLPFIPLPAGTAANYGQIDQATSAWNVPSGLAARLTGADDVSFVLRCRVDCEQMIRDYIFARLGIRLLGPLFSKVVLSGHGAGAELAAGVAAGHPSSFDALVTFAGTTGTVIAQGAGGGSRAVHQRPAPDAPAKPVLMMTNALDSRYPPAGGIGAATRIEVAAAFGVESFSPTVALYAHQNVPLLTCLTEWSSPWAVAVPVLSDTTVGGVRTVRLDGATPVEAQMDLVPVASWNPDWVPRMVTFLGGADVGVL